MSVLLGRCCTGTWGGDTELSGVCAGLSPGHPSRPCLPQSSTGGQGAPTGHSSLTCALQEEGCDQLLCRQPCSPCKPRIPRGTSDCGCAEPQLGETSEPNAKLQEAFSSIFTLGKETRVGKGSPVLLPLPGFPAGGQKRTTQPCEMFGACLCTQHSGLEVRPNGGLKGFQMCQNNIKI